MDVAQEMRLTEHQRYWLERIQACEAQGLSITAYAAEHGFPVRAMYDAKKVLVKKGVLPVRLSQLLEYRRAVRADDKVSAVPLFPDKL